MNEQALLKKVKALKNTQIKDQILDEYEECGDILEATERVKMFMESMDQLKEVE